VSSAGKLADPAGYGACGDMLEFSSSRFVGLIQIVAQLTIIFGEPGEFKDQEAADVSKKTLEDAASFCNQLELEIVAEKLRRMKDICRPGSFTNEHREAIIEIHNRIHDDLKLRRFLSLESREIPYFGKAREIFGSKVEQKFPNATEDIEGAGNCLALGQPTAAVFHLMRAMELAVQTLSSTLDIQNVEREWGKLLSDIHKKIEKMPKGTVRDEWSEVHANLYHVKQAWRHSTMHPKETYTFEQARDVLSAVRAFMDHLSDLV
jgi:HEPN domain-containing protein